MRRGVVAALAAMMWLAGCGGAGGSLPPSGNGTPPDSSGPVVPPDQVVDPNPSTPPPSTGEESKPGDPPPAQAPTSLWPLTTGSRWTYHIQDPNFAQPYTKVVEVKGPSEVPDMKLSAVLVESRQERQRDAQQELYVERSWQLQLKSGLVVRVREADFKDDLTTAIRVTRWADPSTGAATYIMKGLAGEPEANAQHRDFVREIVTLGGDPNNPETKDRTYVWTVTREPHPVSVPAGTFTNAIKLVRTKIDKDGQATKERTYWLVPGVGKVKEEGERTELLQSYDIKQ